jgi:hypothetical protein
MTGDPFIENPELLTEIAIRAFARATKDAIAENDRLGIPSYGGKDGQIVVRQPPQPPDPWLQAMLDDVYNRLRAMSEARGKGEFSDEESARYFALVRELEDIDDTMRDRERGTKR